MNAFELYQDDNAECEMPASSRKTPSAKSSSRSPRSNGFGKRRGKSPQQFNGMHRRRTKRIRW